MTPSPNKPAILAVLLLAALGFGGAAYWKHGRAQQPPPALTAEQVYFSFTTVRAATKSSTS